MKKYTSIVIDSNFVYTTLGVTPPKENILYSSFRIANDPPYSERFAQSDNNSVVFIIAYDMYTLVPPTKEQSNFLADIAIKNGAALLITEMQLKNYPCLVVPNVIEALYKMLNAFFDKFTPPTVAVTGNIGKSTTTGLVTCVLQDDDTSVFPIVQSNANDIRGVVNSLCLSNAVCSYLVKEVMEGPPPGTAKIISDIIKPDIAVITQTSNAHIEYFDSINHIFESSLEIQSGMPSDGVLLLNGDDCYQANAGTDLKKMYYAIENKNADFLASNIELSAHGTSFDFTYQNITTKMHINYIGKHNVYCALAAIAVAKWASVPNDVIQKRLLREKPTGIRQNIVNVDGYLLYMDCFNASEDSMYSSLDALKILGGKQKIAVIGDIVELGQHAKAVHERIGKFIASSNIDILLCFGEFSAYVAENASANKNISVFHSTKQEDIVAILKTNATKEDIILFKASRAMKLEEIANKVFGTNFSI
ncbi:MAG: UDP-N-acetylmuramoyl-tripeptide--D-alanyl-D-alanine ligase [Defluviitaleaceae bacterium]|nr:UDP-N-acetylmuramoyl-tripeptide--D-alanyl-D-alanine ligase [Defluviitaleaceae bacterium]